MNPLTEIMASASAGMRVQSERIGLAAENLSNVDTPGYRRKLLVVDDALNPGAVFRATRVALDGAEGELRFEPAHPMADEAGYVTLSNVSLMTEMADIREANRMYEANLNAFQQARSMYQSLLDVLRR